VLTPPIATIRFFFLCDMIFVCILATFSLLPCCYGIEPLKRVTITIGREVALRIFHSWFLQSTNTTTDGSNTQSKHEELKKGKLQICPTGLGLTNNHNGGKKQAKSTFNVIDSKVKADSGHIKNKITFFFGCLITIITQKLLPPALPPESIP
jgi:hypothetical protein